MRVGNPSYSYHPEGFETGARSLGGGVVEWWSGGVVEEEEEEEEEEERLPRSHVR